MNKDVDIALLMSKAAESLQAAQELVEKDHFGFCASRAYYAMFYCAKAALLHRELQYARHSAVIASFNQQFVRTGIFTPEMFKSFQKAFDLRGQGDYSLIPLDEERAKHVLREAVSFAEKIKEYLQSEGYSFEEEKSSQD